MSSCKPTNQKSNKEEHIRKPDWLKIKLNTNDEYRGLKKLMREKTYIQFVRKHVVRIFMSVGESVVQRHL